VHRAASIAALARRDRVLISTCLVILTALAWGYLFLLNRRMSASVQYDTMMAAMGMATGVPWTPTDAFFTFLMWAVMMVGMMAGSAMPVLLLFGAARSAGVGRLADVPRGEWSVPADVLLFGLGYVAAWVVFSAVATLAQWGLHEAAMLTPMMSASSPRVAGAILIVAGAYQLTPFKGACLTHCRSPLGFLMTNWRDGNVGAFVMGVRHGAYCLGCCWALMGVLFVVGVMNLVWVAALSIFVLIEKVGPTPALVTRTAGLAMVIVGLLLVARVA